MRTKNELLQEQIIIANLFLSAYENYINNGYLVKDRESLIYLYESRMNWHEHQDQETTRKHPMIYCFEDMIWNTEIGKTDYIDDLIPIRTIEEWKINTLSVIFENFGMFMPNSMVKIYKFKQKQ